jgi:hypothetical protein
MRKKQERRQLADLIKQVDTKTRRLISRTEFFNSMITLNSDDIWQHQQKWYIERQMKETMKQSTAKQALIA